MSPLLSLAPELRIIIYRLVLVEQCRIKISDQHKPQEPGILQVNQQIRREATDIYYFENTFKLVIEDYDTTTMQKWFQSSDKRKHCRQVYGVHQSTNWKNLLVWLKAVFDYKTGGHMPGQSSKVWLVFIEVCSTCWRG